MRSFFGLALKIIVSATLLYFALARESKCRDPAIESDRGDLAGAGVSTVGLLGHPDRAQVATHCPGLRTIVPVLVCPGVSLQPDRFIF